MASIWLIAGTSQSQIYYNITSNSKCDSLKNIWIFVFDSIYYVCSYNILGADMENGQSAAKLPDKEEGSTTISRKESREYPETPDNKSKSLFSSFATSLGGGVYMLKCNSGSYIGKTKLFTNRMQAHRADLRRNRHWAIGLQEAYNNKELITFHILSNNPEDETSWIEKLKPKFNAVIDPSINFSTPKFAEIIAERNNIPVVELTLAGEFIREHKSITQCAKAMGDQTTNISAVCNGKLRYVKNRIFVYKSKYVPGTHYLKESNRGKSIAGAIASSKHVIDVDEKIIYPSVSEAERANKIPRGSLGKAMKYKRHYKGRKFRFVEDIV